MTGIEETSPSEKSLRDQSIDFSSSLTFPPVMDLNHPSTGFPSFSSSFRFDFLKTCVPYRFFRVCFSAGSVFTRPYALALFFLFYHRRPVRFHLDGSVRRLPPPFLRLLKQTPLVYYLLPVFFFFVKLFLKSKSTPLDFYEFCLFCFVFFLN